MHVSPYRPPPWMPGQDVVMDLIVCCPECGSRIVNITHKYGQSMRYLTCGACGHAWRRVHDEGVRRVLVAR